MRPSNPFSTLLQSRPKRYTPKAGLKPAAIIRRYSHSKRAVKWRKNGGS